jgi:hypothetical protein
MLCIDRFDTKWDGYNYCCRLCESVGTAVADISHTDSCPVSNPDDISLTHFSESTERQLREIILTAITRRREVEYVDDMDNLDELNGVKWVDSGSSNRLILGLGRVSSRGEFHLPDRRGLVLKIDPNVRTDTEYTPVSANIDELYTWEKAVQTQTSQLFGDILACACDGAWLVMEQCIPVYPSIVSESKDALADVDRDKYIRPLIDSLNEHNWSDPDWKHGNIGVTDDNNPVLIDYGTGPTHQSSKDQ